MSERENDAEVGQQREELQLRGQLRADPGKQVGAAEPHAVLLVGAGETQGLEPVADRVEVRVVGEAEDLDGSVGALGEQLPVDRWRGRTRTPPARSGLDSTRADDVDRSRLNASVEERGRPPRRWRSALPRSAPTSRRTALPVGPGQPLGGRRGERDSAGQVGAVPARATTARSDDGAERPDRRTRHTASDRDRHPGGDDEARGTPHGAGGGVRLTPMPGPGRARCWSCRDPQGRARCCSCTVPATTTGPSPRASSSPDEHATTAAVREVAEETGLDIWPRTGAGLSALRHGSRVG